MELVFGVSHFPHLYGMTMSEAGKFLNKVIDLGVEHFDTAESYCHGHSEYLLGKVAYRSTRITTKIGGGIGEKSSDFQAIHHTQPTTFL